MNKKNTVNAGNRFMASPFGTMLKSFFGTLITLYLVELQQGLDMFSWDLIMIKKLLTGALVSILPVVINWLNPAYKNYGK